MNSNLNIKNYFALALGLLLMIIALVLASRTSSTPEPPPENAQVFATALHYTPSPPRIETVLVTAPAVTQVLVTPTPTPTSIFRGLARSNLDQNIDFVFSDPAVGWKIISCCRQALLTPVYDPSLKRWCVLVSGSGARVSDGNQIRLAAFAAVLVPNQDVPDQEHYQISTVIFGLGSSDPRVSTIVDRQGRIFVQLQGFDGPGTGTLPDHTIALSPSASGNHSEIVKLIGNADEVVPDTLEY